MTIATPILPSYFIVSAMPASPATRSRIMGIVTMRIGTGPVGVMTIAILSRQLGPLVAILNMAGLGLSGLSLVSRKTDQGVT
jgi:hypothetical protein